MIGAYERIAQRLLQGQPKARPFCMVLDGRLLTGTQSLHRTKQGRTWRLFCRIKLVRKPLTAKFYSV